MKIVTKIPMDIISWLDSVLECDTSFDLDEDHESGTLMIKGGMSSKNFRKYFDPSHLGSLDVMYTFKKGKKGLLMMYVTEDGHPVKVKESHTETATKILKMLTDDTIRKAYEID